MRTMWMIRGDAGRLYDEFRDTQSVGIGFAELAGQPKAGVSRDELVAIYQARIPEAKRGRAISAASQAYRFVNVMAKGDHVVTYSPGNRTYLVGVVTGDADVLDAASESGLTARRAVQWLPHEVDRDDLDEASRNMLGSTLTVFNVAEPTAGRLVDLARNGRLAGATPDPSINQLDAPAADVAEDRLAGLDALALERIKDQVNALDWDEMQELVAGVLRAMGYRTQVSPPGADRGRDILASPDGFGFQQPRIVVDVKHRAGRMGSAEVRRFLGGRHRDDRGLFVSTGGFTREAHYEADRAQVPLALWTLDELTRTLLDNYPGTDTETKRLIPLRMFYVPA